jgi:excinuclease ABC subunit C
MAAENAAEAVRKKAAEAQADTDTLEALKKRLRLKTVPVLIEAFDISNLGASLPVGAMVSFLGGKPDKKNYRLFKITDVKGPDDYAMMREVLRRRYSASEMHTPNLILIDGGKGQLNIAVKVMDELGIEGVAIAALAKDKSSGERTFSKAKETPKGERVYLPGVKDPILLREGSSGDLLLRRIRDEVHRFAIRYQRKLRGKAALSSPLDGIAGIGEKKKKTLYKKFGDLNGIRKASLAELAETPGITEKLAGAIKEGVGF